MSENLQAYLDAGREAALAAGGVLEKWRSRFSVREKARADLVTDADFESQELVRTMLLGRFPDHIFLGEETLPESKSYSFDELRESDEPTWVVDPLDGTANYVHDVPAYCVSIGLWAGRKPLVGVIHDPRLNETFTAIAGGGAFLNGEPMRVGSAETLEDGLLATGFPADVSVLERNLDHWRRFAFVSQGLRRTGSTALNLAYVAAGRFDGYWAFDNKPWDVAAGAILVAEAGGSIAGVDGSDYDPFRPDIVACAPKLLTPMLAEIRPDKS